MINRYSFKKWISPTASKTTCLEGWADEYIAELYSGKRASSLPPGGPHFVALGVLAVIPVASLSTYLILTLFIHQPLEFQGKFFMGSGAVFIAIHCFFMGRVTLG
jgi:hypothetical protein